ncbi:hypothetical protein M407DRAFT_25835 [Tulasnella calospora MUT 4182]|uniref:AA9 family lytic polysaccharide monooxygenase n=1 Tax=Tulasnella calospora MUT 4182 TaxID=1051891 RepID=A0A0C3KTI3_9AGAM|nr:hypothetical protein M407DRAFT_25835 [Tulasnella calospora MUT 4182]
MPSLSLLTVTIGFISVASAHTIFQRLRVNGVDQGYLNGIRYPTYDGPITDVTSNDVICNGGPNPLVKPFSKTVINVPAGSTVQAEWHHVLQPNGYDPSDKADPIDPSHLGPTIAYLAKVPDATQESVTGLRWFKIQEDGFDGTTWGVQRMITAKGLHTIKIPSCIPPGNYFLRAEIIALHAASSYPGAQLYMECAQINVTGGGSANPATVSFPGAYKGTDPGIKYNLYAGSTTYTIPGPPVFTCNGDDSGPASPTSVPTTTSRTTTVTTSRTPLSTIDTTTTTTTTAAGGYASHYAQCGGQGYTGPTQCEPPYTCKYSNQWYSQCL